MFTCMFFKNTAQLCEVDFLFRTQLILGEIRNGVGTNFLHSLNDPGKAGVQSHLLSFSILSGERRWGRKEVCDRFLGGWEKGKQA